MMNRRVNYNHTQIRNLRRILRWKSGIYIQNIGKKREKNISGESKSLEDTIIWWYIFGYAIGKENI